MRIIIGRLTNNTIAPDEFTLIAEGCCSTIWRIRGKCHQLGARSFRPVRYYPKLIAFLGYYPFPENTETTGGRIAKYRYSHGLSYKGMGKLIGVDGSTICSWENHQTSPFPQSLTNCSFGSKQHRSLSGVLFYLLTSEKMR